MYWEIQLKLPLDVIPMDSGWPEENDLVHYYFKELCTSLSQNSSGHRSRE
jgi:hypothetical protein